MEVFTDAMRFLKDNSIRFSFILDCIVLINSDCRLHEHETELIERYCAMAGIRVEEKDYLINVHKIISSKNKHYIYNLLSGQQIIDKKYYQYLAQYYTIDVPCIQIEKKLCLAHL